MWSAGRVLNEFVKGMSEHMDVGNDVREALKVFEEVENVRVWKGKKRMSDGDEENGDECVLTETMTGFHRRHPSIPMTLSASSSSFSITMSPGPECDDANTGANESKRTENCSAHQADGAIHGHTNFPTLESIVPLPAATVELMSKTFGRSTLNSAGSVIPPTTLDGMQDTIEASDRPTITMNNLTTPSLSHTPARLRCGCSCGDGCDGGLFPVRMLQVYKALMRHLLTCFGFIWLDTYTRNVHPNKLHLPNHGNTHSFCILLPINLCLDFSNKVLSR